MKVQHKYWAATRGEVVSVKYDREQGRFKFLILNGEELEEAWAQDCKVIDASPINPS